VDVTTIPVGWYFKRDYYHLRNFIRAKTVAFNQRHGGYSKADGTGFTDLTDATSALIVGNNFDKGIFRLNDGPRLIVSCRMGGNVELYYGGRRTDGPNLASYTINANPGYTQAASYNEFVGCSFVGNIRAGENEGTGTKPWKVWGAAEETKWGAAEPNQGDRIKGVKNYKGPVDNQPTDGNGTVRAPHQPLRREDDRRWRGRLSGARRRWRLSRLADDPGHPRRTGDRHRGLAA